MGTQLSSEYGQYLLDSAKKSTTDVVKKLSQKEQQRQLVI